MRAIQMHGRHGTVEPAPVTPELVAAVTQDSSPGSQQPSTSSQPQELAVKRKAAEDQTDSTSKKQKFETAEIDDDLWPEWERAHYTWKQLGKDRYAPPYLFGESVFTTNAELRNVWLDFICLGLVPNHTLVVEKHPFSLFHVTSPHDFEFGYYFATEPVAIRKSTAPYQGELVVRYGQPDVQDPTHGWAVRRFTSRLMRPMVEHVLDVSYPEEQPQQLLSRYETYLKTPAFRRQFCEKAQLSTISQFVLSRGTCSEMDYPNDPNEAHELQEDNRVHKYVWEMKAVGKLDESESKFTKAVGKLATGVSAYKFMASGEHEGMNSSQVVKNVLGIEQEVLFGFGRVLVYVFVSEGDVEWDGIGKPSVEWNGLTKQGRAFIPSETFLLTFNLKCASENGSSEIIYQLVIQLDT